ncbi:MAG TPA: hypothetical protein VMR33_12915 [Candidatus Baltobacteraceae bacterium]|jgi:hypothetical protein|nr:hypothetical protein [Candidatus Baltobacteraceae bacterium]
MNGFMRVASDVKKRPEMGQFGIFSPLLYQLSYPARLGRIIWPRQAAWQAALREFSNLDQP